jgi:hypothetical protein
MGLVGGVSLDGVVCGVFDIDIAKFGLTSGRKKRGKKFGDVDV